MYSVGHVTADGSSDGGRRAWRFAALVATAAFLASASVPTAWAADEGVKAAKKHVTTAKKHYALGKYDKALEEFMAAYYAKEDPSLLFNIAQCHRKLGEDEQALDRYRAYLRENPAPGQRETALKFVDQLEKKVAKKKAEEEQKAAARSEPKSTVAAAHEASPSPAPVEPEAAAAPPTPIPAIVAAAPNRVTPEIAATSRQEPVAEPAPLPLPAAPPPPPATVRKPVPQPETPDRPSRTWIWLAIGGVVIATAAIVFVARKERPGCPEMVECL